MNTKEAPSTKDKQIKLNNGKLLGYAEYGDPDGKPIFYFHGWPSSRLEAHVFHERAVKLGARIIAVDRPGIGLSDFKPGRTIREWPKDVAELADNLQLERFGVLGFSSGGPYVLACAYEIPQRLTAVGLVSAVGPLDLPEAVDFIEKQELQITSLARKFPWLAQLLIWWMTRQFQRNPDSNFSKFIGELSEPDRVEFSSNPERKQWLLEMMGESHRSGTKGLLWDIKLEGKAMGFRLEELTKEIHLWQGEEDNLAFPAMGHYMADKIPNCRPVFYSGEGHFSLFFNHVEEILRVLIS